MHKIIDLAIQDNRLKPQREVIDCGHTFKDVLLVSSRNMQHCTACRIISVTFRNKQ